MGSSSSSLPEAVIGELKTNLLEELRNDNIVRLFRYNCKLSPMQVTKHLAHHKFIICRTSLNWYYSIEKNTKGIYIQRGSCISRVRDYFKGMARDGVSSDSSAFNEMLSSNTTIKDIVRWIYESSQLAKSYHVILSNCQDFAWKLHDEFARDGIDDAALNMGLH